MNEYPREQLLAAFNRVADRENWKNPIRARLAKLSNEEREVIREAVRYFAGCTPRFYDEGPCTIVKAEGYYVAVGA